MAHYHIYLLTVWREPTTQPDQEITWRFGLENPRTGHHRRFADADSLAAALQAGIADGLLGWDNTAPQESDGEETSR